MHRHPQQKNSAGGFTLIELLVVISIVTLLSSVFFAVLGVSKARANDARAIVTAKGLQTVMQSDPDAVQAAMLVAGISTGETVWSDGADGKFDALIGALHASGHLAVEEIPEGPYPFSFTDYGPRTAANPNSPGYIVEVYLPTMTPTASAPSGSCRPFECEGASCQVSPPETCGSGMEGCAGGVINEGHEIEETCEDFPGGCPEQFCRNDVANQDYCICSVY
jgi:prepilin-type N-terminal cleavage/methylation domain-containing protein